MLNWVQKSLMDSINPGLLTSTKPNNFKLLELYVLNLQVNSCQLTSSTQTDNRPVISFSVAFQCGIRIYRDRVRYFAQ